MDSLPFPPTQVRWPRDRKGHFESFWIKGNAPDRKTAIWIKYNLLAAAGSDRPPLGESWAVLLDGGGHHRVAKRVVPPEEVDIAPEGGILRLGEALLTEGAASGTLPAAPDDGLCAAAWDLTMSGDEEPLLDYPHAWMFTAGFPRVKNLLIAPRLELHGRLTIDDRDIDLDGWVGLLGHNWGRAHAFEMAYSNANRFAERDDARFEGYCARVYVGPFLLPRLSGCVLRLGSTTYEFNHLHRLSTNGLIQFPRFTFQVRGGDGYRISGHIEAQRREFVGLTYADPDGGLSDTLNTKFGRGELVLQRRVIGRWEDVQRLTSDVFELEFLLRDVDHGIDVFGGDPLESGY